MNYMIRFYQTSYNHDSFIFIRQSQVIEWQDKVQGYEDALRNFQKDASEAAAADEAKKSEKATAKAKSDAYAEEHQPFSAAALKYLVTIRLRYQAEMDNKIDKNVNIWRIIALEY